MESRADIEERAAEWLAKQDGGGWTPDDEAAFQGWLNASTANRVAYLRLDAVWQQANRLRAFGAGRRSGAVPPPGEWQQQPFFEGHPPASSEAAAAPLSSFADDEVISANREARSAHDATQVEPRRLSLAHPIRAIAATLLVAIATGPAWYLWPDGPSYSTPVGGLAAVPMIDGSKITLNTDSEVRVAVTDVERRVELTQGEAFFEVASDPARPFVVEAGNQRFVAVGTKFSVRRDGDANRLIVTEGRVRVESDGGPAGRRILPTEVSAGGVARSGDAGVLVQEKPVPDAEIMLSWRSGYLVFKDTTLADAVAEFNRYNETRIVIDDADTARIRIGGNFRSTNVEAFVRLLEDGFPLRIERQEEQIVLSRN